MQEKIRYPRRPETITMNVGSRCEGVEIEIAPLIREIWLADIETMMSSQEVSPGIAWIEFPQVADLLRFLDIVTKYESGADKLYTRICHQVTGLILSPPWEFEYNLWDRFQGREEQRDNGAVSFFATVGVYFPRPEITLLIERLRFFNSVNDSPEPMK